MVSRFVAWWRKPSHRTNGSVIVAAVVDAWASHLTDKRIKELEERVARLEGRGTYRMKL